MQKAAAILQKHNVNYRIIISPLYEQIKLNPTDVNVLNELFGKNYVYDFSGKNELTEPVGNYYENSHYRSFIAAKLFQRLADGLSRATPVGPKQISGNRCCKACADTLGSSKQSTCGKRAARSP